MPLGLGIVEVLRAIPPRIEVAGHGATVRITAGTFDAALDYAREVYESPAVLDVEVRNRLWPRVTIVVATDPQPAGVVPPVDELRERAVEDEAALRAARRSHRARAGSHRAKAQPAETEEPAPSEPAAVRAESGRWMLEEIFAHQEQLRQERVRVPVQRRRPV